VADIFQEVDEDVRREQMLRWWKRYGNYVAVAAVIVALSAGGIWEWRKHVESQRQAIGAQVHQGQVLAREGKFTEAAKAYEDAVLDGNAGYRAVAGLQRAHALLAAKDLDGAIAAYEKVAADSAVETEWRDIASLLAAYHMVGKATYPDVERRIAGIATDNNPWRHLAREVLAAAKLRAGDAEGARALFLQIADDATATAGVRARAAELLAALAPKAG
jgi:hypothetical protein